jgi:hypothetical protein
VCVWSGDEVWWIVLSGDEVGWSVMGVCRDDVGVVCVCGVW